MLKLEAMEKERHATGGLRKSLAAWANGPTFEGAFMKGPGNFAGGVVHVPS